MPYYLVSDVHGHFDLFMRLLDCVKFSDSDSLLLLGDNIDRGEQNTEMLDFILGHSNVESLIGNHELLMLDDIKLALSGRASRINCDWFCNGGAVTFDQMLEREENESGYTENIIREVSGWDYYRVFLDYYPRPVIAIHAGYYYYGTAVGGDIGAILKCTPDFDKVWVRDEFICNPGIPGTLTVFGHTITNYLGEPGKAWYDTEHNDKICIDAGPYANGTLCALRLDDMQIFYAGKD